MKFRAKQEFITTRDLTSFVRNTIVPAGTRVIIIRTAEEGTMGQAIVDPGTLGLSNPLGGLPVIVRFRDVR